MRLNETNWVCVACCLSSSQAQIGGQNLTFKSAVVSFLRPYWEVFKISKQAGCKRASLALILPTMLLAACQSDIAIEGSQNTTVPQYTPELSSLSQHTTAPEWFRDAKLGIYFHWGPYTVAAKESEWYPRFMHFDLPPEAFKDGASWSHADLADWHTENFGDPAQFGYHDMIPLFTGEHFDADEWADLFQKSGARFAGPVAEHHDGYAMWDSDVTPWNAADTGPKRDITGELIAALRARDMKVITTFHHAKNLQRYRGKSIEESRTFTNGATNYFWDSHYPWIQGLATASEDPDLRLLYGNVPEDEWVDTVWLAKVKEVIDLYEPDIVWFDSWLV